MPKGYNIQWCDECCKKHFDYYIILSRSKLTGNHLCFHKFIEQKKILTKNNE